MYIKNLEHEAIPLLDNYRLVFTFLEHWHSPSLKVASFEEFFVSWSTRLLTVLHGPLFHKTTSGVHFDTCTYN